jgi:hypothetical protein
VAPEVSVKNSDHAKSVFLMSERLSKTALTSAFTVLLVAWLAVLWPLPKGLFKESDTFWLIEVGHNILNHFSLPAFNGGVDPYSIGAVKSPWIVYQWTSEVLLSLANHFGLIGVSILGCSTLALLLCVLVFRRMLKLGVHAVVALLVIAIVLHSTFPDIATLRPQLFSFVFLFLLQVVVEDVWASGAKSKSDSLKSLLTRIFLISLLWTNFHVSFPLGFAILSLYLCAAFIQVLLHKDANKTRLRVFALMTAVYVGATLINPYGIKLWFFLQTLNGIYKTQELQPLDWSRSGLYVVVYCLLMLSNLSLWKSVARPKLALAAMLFVLGCLHGRLIIYFCLSACTLVGEALTAMLPSVIRMPWISRTSNVIEVVAVKGYYPVIILLLSIFVVCSQPIYIPRSIPLKAAEYLAFHKPSGNFFCPDHAASYLIYRFHGNIKVFIDGRLDRYDAELCKRYLDAMSGVGWKELFAEYNITEALLPNDAALNRAIEHDADWEKEYQDDSFSISVRRNH